MTTKVMTIVGTRPEIIKLSRVIPEMDKHFDHVLVHTGQNYDYEINQIFFDQMQIRKPDFFLEAAGKNAAQTIAKVIERSDKLMEEVKPDTLLILGDTNSCLSVISAKRRKIPNFHMEAGNRCFDQRVPEEINRKIVDHLSDINLPYTEHARRYLISEGIRPETIIKTGSPMKEVLDHFMPQINESRILSTMELHPRDYFVVSIHREENIDNTLNFHNLMDSLNGLALEYQKPVIVSTHPRTRKRIEAMPNLVKNSQIQWLKPLGFFDYVNLQQHAFCTLSDSGTITEESSILGFPAVMLREAHERPEGMDEGTLIMCGTKRVDVLESVTHITSTKNSLSPGSMADDYDVDNVTIKIPRIILSYIHYIKQNKWRKRT